MVIPNQDSKEDPKLKVEGIRQKVRHDRPNRNDDIDVDAMSYDQLLELGENIGSVSKGLTNEQIDVY